MNKLASKFEPIINIIGIDNKNAPKGKISDHNIQFYIEITFNIDKSKQSKESKNSLTKSLNKINRLSKNDKIMSEDSLQNNDLPANK